MRISVTNSDPGYFAGSYRCTAYLDGVKLDNCVTADEEEGLALCYDMSDEGRQYARMSGEVRLIELRGEVEINTRDENGVCILCGVSGAEMHHDHCPRAKEWNNTEAQDRLVVFGDPAKSGGVVEGANGERFRIDLPPSHEMSKATGGAVRGWDFGLVGERAHPFPPFREWKPGDSPVLPEAEPYEEGGLRVRFIDPEKSYVTAEECKAYVAIRLKASEPLACYACGSLDGHDERCPVGFLVTLLTGGTATLHIPARPSIISKLMARRRKLIAKAKRASPTDSAIGSAIAAMNKPGRANEL